MKPILFNTEMVKAILGGRKTCTRRLVKGIPSSASCTFRCMDYVTFVWKAKMQNADILLDKQADVQVPCRPGDVLYVRETWTTLHYVDTNGRTHYGQEMYFYAADGEPDVTLYDADGFEQDDQRIRWRPSIHMPKEAARIFLRVKSVRPERLQSITRNGAISEGCNAAVPIVEFSALWDSTVKPAERERCGWAANPWVWVIEFERIEKGEAK